MVSLGKVTLQVTELKKSDAASQSEGNRSH